MLKMKLLLGQRRHARGAPATVEAVEPVRGSGGGAASRGDGAGSAARERTQRNAVTTVKKKIHKTATHYDDDTHCVKPH